MKIAWQYGPARPIAPGKRVLGRWEGEQAASRNIAEAIEREAGATITSCPPGCVGCKVEAEFRAMLK